MIAKGKYRIQKIVKGKNEIANANENGYDYLPYLFVEKNKIIFELNEDFSYTTDIKIETNTNFIITYN